MLRLWLVLRQMHFSLPGCLLSPRASLQPWLGFCDSATSRRAEVPAMLAHGKRTAAMLAGAAAAPAAASE